PLGLWTVRDSASRHSYLKGRDVMPDDQYTPPMPSVVDTRLNAVETTLRAVQHAFDEAEERRATREVHVDHQLTQLRDMFDELQRQLVQVFGPSMCRSTLLHQEDAP